MALAGREVLDISGDEKIRRSVNRNFKKLSVIGVWQRHRSIYRIDSFARLQKKIQQIIDRLRCKAELGAQEHVLIFRIDAVVQDYFHLAGENNIENASRYAFGPDQSDTNTLVSTTIFNACLQQQFYGSLGVLFE